MVPIEINKVAGRLNKSFENDMGYLENETSVPAMPNMFFNYDQDTEPFPNQSINAEDTLYISNQGRCL